MSVLPVELLDMFESQCEREFPFGGYLTFTDQYLNDYESEWKFYVQEGIGILKCSLRDEYGNAEDFEWELTLKTA